MRINFIRHSLIFVSMLALISSCVAEDSFVEHNERQMDIKRKSVSLEELRAKYELQGILSSLFDQSGRMVFDSINQFYVDDEKGVFLEVGSYHSFTFLITRPDSRSLPLENLVISKLSSGGYESFIYTYNVTDEELIKIEKREWVDLTGKLSRKKMESGHFVEDIMSKFYFNGACHETNFVFVQGQSCPNGHDAQYIIDGGSCIYLGEWNGPTASYWTYATTLVPCDDAGGGGPGPAPGPSTPGGPGGPGGVILSTPTPNCNRGNCPPEFTDAPPPDCNKIKNLFANTVGAKAAVQSMDALTGNQNEEFKYKLAGSNITSGTGTPGAAPTPDNPPTKYEFICHTHNAPATSTYSVFSGDDIVFIGRLLANNHIDTSKFVLFVTTADGTKYALTITDPNKFKAKFLTPGQPNFSWTVFNQYSNAYAAAFSGVNPSIVENSTDYEADKVNFLKFLKDGDTGLSMFESTDNWETFAKLNLTTTVTPTGTSSVATPINCP